MWDGSEERPTVDLASTDIKTAFDVARPKYTANIMGDQDVHGWIAAAFLRQMAGLEGQAIFQHVDNTFDNTFPSTRCIRQRGVDAARLWLKMAMQILWTASPLWKRKKLGLHMETHQGGRRSNLQLHVGGQLDDERLDRGNGEMRPGAKTGKSVWWADQKMDDMKIRTRTWLRKSPFEKKFKILGYTCS